MACAKRAKSSWEAIKFKCTASEGLCVIPVMQRFVEKVARPTAAKFMNVIFRKAAEAACLSFLALCDVIMLLQVVAQGEITGRQLHDAVVAHLRLFVLAYGIDALFPKCHYALHLGSMLLRHGVLLSCFVHERKHKMVMRFATPCTNTTNNLSRTVLEEVLVSHVYSLQVECCLGLGVFLRGMPSHCSRQLQS